jgi:hypothetical protein
MTGFVPLFGYQPNRAGTDAFLSTLNKPTLALAGPDLALDESKDVFLGNALLQVNPGWKRGAQTIGSCVGWGWALSVDVLAACDVVLRNEPEAYGGDTLCASVYGFSRVEVRGQKNYGGDGSYGGAAAKAVSNYGTLHLGQAYGTKTYTEQSGTLEKSWGRDGVPDNLEPFAKQHKVANVTLVRTFEEAATAIQNGYPVAVCSGQGFSMTLRDGYLTPSGSWAHCMMFLGVRWKPYPALYCENSWGNCYTGKPDKNVPKPFQLSGGWVKAATCTSMLNGEDSFALAGFEGFKPRQLPDDWLRGIL